MHHVNLLKASWILYSQLGMNDAQSPETQEMIESLRPEERTLLENLASVSDIRECSGVVNRLAGLFAFSTLVFWTSRLGYGQTFILFIYDLTFHRLSAITPKVSGEYQFQVSLHWTRQASLSGKELLMKNSIPEAPPSTHLILSAGLLSKTSMQDVITKRSYIGGLFKVATPTLLFLFDTSLLQFCSSPNWLSSDAITSGRHRLPACVSCPVGGNRAYHGALEPSWNDEPLL